MPRHRVLCIAACCVVATALPVGACLWDTDTIDMEQESFPEVLELITGKFLRHSTEMYEWRIRDREERIKANPDKVALYDDLAVAWHKVGKNDKAIEVMLKKEQLQPGIYETYSNLGTFYIFTGELEKAAEQISKALAINPNAHFGREVYQKLLVEYILSKRKSPTDKTISLPLGEEIPDSDALRARGFAQFVATRGPVRTPENTPGSPRQHALKGVLGMMRFANHDSPLLLEALGDLLCASAYAIDLHEGDANLLAARAYLMASYSTKDTPAETKYRKLAEAAIAAQMPQKNLGKYESALAALEADFRHELEEAERWSAQVRADEIAWVQAGADVDVEFAKKYFEDPSIPVRHKRARQTELITRTARAKKLPWASISLSVAAIIGFAAAGATMIRDRRRRLRLNGEAGK